jgi:hypothetical protein
MSLVCQRQVDLGLKGQVLKPQFHFETLLVDGFQETASVLLVHLEAGPDDPVTLLFE